MARGAGQARVEAVALRLHAAAIRLLRRVRREDHALGLNPARASALSVLVFGGPKTMGELAAAEAVTPATMSRIVGALVELGLVRRAVDRADRRVVRVRATAAGVRLLEAGRRRRIEAVTKLMAGLSAEDVALLERAVGVLERMLGSPEAGGAGAG